MHSFRCSLAPLRDQKEITLILKQNDTKFFIEKVNSKCNQDHQISCRNETKFRNIFVSNTPNTVVLFSTGLLSSPHGDYDCSNTL